MCVGVDLYIDTTTRIDLLRRIETISVRAALCTHRCAGWCKNMLVALGGTHVTLHKLLLQASCKHLRSAQNVKLDADCILNPLEIGDPEKSLSQEAVH